MHAALRSTYLLVQCSFSRTGQQLALFFPHLCLYCCLFPRFLSRAGQQLLVAVRAGPTSATFPTRVSDYGFYAALRTYSLDKVSLA